MTPHFTIEELTRSDVAIRRGLTNNPSIVILQNLKKTATGMEQVRKLLKDKSIYVSSGYRSPVLNQLIGGAPNSDHIQGWAVDFACPGFGTPREVCKALESADLEFSTLIYEGRWVHISFKPGNARKIMTAHFPGIGPATYSKGIA